MTTSFDFHPWKIQTRKGRRTPYRVRWTVAGRQFGTSFVTMALAESFRASLITTARKGEGFDTDSGLPESMERTRRDISFYQHAEQFTAAAWPAAAAKTRVSIIETLSQSCSCRRPGPGGRTRPGHPQARTEKETQPGPARRPARRGRNEGHRLAGPGLPPGQRTRRPLRRRRRPRRPGRQPQRQTGRPRILLPPPPGPAPHPRVRRPPEAAHPEPAQQRQPARRLDTPAGPRRHPGPARRRQPCPGRVHAGGLRHRRPTSGSPLPRLLRLHVLRADAPRRSRRAHQRRLPPPADRLGPPDLRRLQSRRREGVHRRRPGPRAPRP